MTTAAVIRIVLAIDLASMALLALFYLRRRRLHWSGYCFWGLLALALPVFGPFFLIASRPGEPNPDPFPSALLRQQVHEFYLNLKLPAFRIERTAPALHRRHPRRWI